MTSLRHPHFSKDLAAGIAAAALAAGIILASSHGRVDGMTYGDGMIYRYVAAHFTAAPEDVASEVVERGTSLRYGRVGLPAVIWLASAGRPEAMRYAHPVVIIVAAGLAGAALPALLPAMGLIAAALPFAAPGFSLAVAGGFGEVLAVAFGLWAVVLVMRGRWGWSTVALAGALLTRENTGGILLGLAIWFGFLRRDRRAAILLLALLPLGAWYAFVAARFGHIPLLDPYLRTTTDTITTPLVAVWRSLTEAPAGPTVTAGIHLAMALAAFVLWRRSPLGAVAAAAGLQVLSAGRFAWHFEGDAFRAFTFLQLFLLLALAHQLWRTEEPTVRIGSS